VEILHDLLGVDVPTGLSARLESNDFNDRPSKDFQPDVVVSVGPDREPVHAVIVEVQQRKLPSKLKQLARYAAQLWLMLDCPVTVLCVCPDSDVAAFYAKPIETTLSGYMPQPVVLGPDEVPPITDPEQVARWPEVAALSVMMHGRRREVIEALATGLELLKPDDASCLVEYAFRMAGVEAKKYMEEIMSRTTWPVYSPFAKEHFGRGKEEGRTEGIKEGLKEGIEEGRKEGIKEGIREGVAVGEAKAVLTVLATRGIEVPEKMRARIEACTDLPQLEKWLGRAVTAASAADLFA
jgi:hypothetical protein